MLIKQSKKLAVGSGGLVLDAGSARNFQIKFEGGQTSPLIKTRLDVGGNMDGFNLLPASGGADVVEIIIDGDVTGSTITIDDDSSITTGTSGGGGDVIDTPVIAGDDCTVTLGRAGQAANVEVRGGTMKFGTALGASNEVTTVTINGFAGTTTHRIDENWDLRGYAKATVTQDFNMTEQTSPPITLPLVQQLDHSELTVLGDTSGGDWHVFDDSRFTGTGTGTSITGGEWEVQDRAMLNATAIAGGDWTVTSKGDGGIGAVGVEVTNKYSPANLVVDGGSVKTTDLGDTAAGDNAIWNMTIRAGGTAEATDDIYFAGTFDALRGYPSNRFDSHRSVF